ncbi:hypothetical protein [Kutzneria chonburiensis]|uniref:hypothetical protein n=1 Tax=Kutzneria chonburiensis TaxID=1483604 RepID=UPI002362B2D2|nr:hypothetical protein [Kutzneria chonburiensis]
MVPGIGAYRPDAGSLKTVVATKTDGIVGEWRRHLGPEAVADRLDEEDGGHAVRRVTVGSGTARAEYVFRPTEWRDAFYRLKAGEHWRLVPWLRMLGWLAARLVVILTIMIAPDMRDRPMLQQMAAPMPVGLSWPRRALYLLAGQGKRTVIGPLLRILWRMGLAVLLTATVLAFLIASPLITGGLLLLAISGFAVTLLRPGGHLVAQVAAIAGSAQHRDTLIDAIADDLEWLQKRCPRVCVIAHSMGGYLVYRLLADSERGRRLRDVQVLLTVGSGLRPMHVLASSGRSRKLILPSFIVLLVAVGVVGRLEPLLVLFTKMVLGMVGAASVLGWNTGAPLAMVGDPQGMPADGYATAVANGANATVSAMWGQLTDLGGWGSVLNSAFLMFIVGYLLRDELLAALSPLPLVGRKLVWRNYSSPSDSVGRLGSFASPNSQPITVPEVGIPLWDHVRGFGARSITSRLLALDLLGMSRAVDEESLSGWVDRAEGSRAVNLARFDRRRRLNGVVATVSLVAIVVEVGLGRLPLLWGVLTAFAAWSVWAVLFALVARRASVRAMREVSVSQVDVRSMRPRPYVGVCLLLAAFVLFGAASRLAADVPLYHDLKVLAGVELVVLMLAASCLLACGLGVIAGYRLVPASAGVLVVVVVTLLAVPPITFQYPLSSKPGIITSGHMVVALALVVWALRSDRRALGKP